MFTVKLMLFGLFRKDIPSEFISVPLNKGTTLFDFKNIISDFFIKEGHLDKAKSVYESAFSTESEIIFSDFMIDKDMVLAILPPVNGG